MLGISIRRKVHILYSLFASVLFVCYYFLNFRSQVVIEFPLS